MAENQSASDLDAAREAISRANLPHPDGSLANCFIDGAVDPELAAQYLLGRCSDNDLEMAAFVADWRRLISAFMCNDPIRPLHDKHISASITARDGGVCFLTKLSASFWDPLIVNPIFWRPDESIVESLSEMLAAFLSPGLCQWILSDDSNGSNVYRNHWLVRKSAAAAFSEGFFRFKFTQGSKFYFKRILVGGITIPEIAYANKRRMGTESLVDQSGFNLDTPDQAALDILSRFAEPIRWIHVSRYMQQKTHRRRTRSMLPRLAALATATSKTITAPLWSVWLRVPSSLRIYAYQSLATVGAYMYGPSSSLKVQRLPFGLYLKQNSLTWHGGLVNEYGALALIRRSSRLPVPQPLDLVSDSRMSYLLTTRLPGYTMGMCIDILSDQELGRFECGLKTFLVAFQSIPKEQAMAKSAISNAIGTACYDHRINAAFNYDEARGDFIGPFSNEAEFNRTMQCAALPGVIHRDGHSIVLSHGDINMRNVLVDQDGALLGVVDWELSGWYPEYWDYTKARYITKFQKRWVASMERVFGEFGDFTEEYAIEWKLWHYCF